MQIDLKNTTVKIIDGSGTPKVLAMKLKDGTCAWTEKQNVEYVKDRGKLGSTRLGDEEPMDVKIDALYEFLKSSSGASAATVEEAIKGTGTGYTSTGDGCEPYACSIELEHTPVCTSSDKEKVLLTLFRWEQIDHDPKTGMLSITGKCNVKAPTVTRTAQV